MIGQAISNSRRAGGEVGTMIDEYTRVLEEKKWHCTINILLLLFSLLTALTIFEVHFKEIIIWELLSTSALSELPAAWSLVPLKQPVPDS